MKGRMDVLNISNQRSSKSSAMRDIIKIETDDEREKENCETELLFIDMRNKGMDVDLEPKREEASDIEDVEMDDKDEDEAFSNSEVLSAHTEQENMKDGKSLPRTRPDFEIKYEDDIEEEDYDSEDSEDIREMPSLSSRPGVDSSNPVRNCIQITHEDQMENFDPSFSSSYNDSSMSVFNDSITAKVINNGSRENIHLNGSVGRANDSVLLSIVYATINVPFSQVSKCLTAYNLSKSQLSIIRKVRRQVKNRLYAQNCRRRRIAHIKNLADELRQIRTEKEKMFCLRAELLARKEAMERRYSELYNFVMNAVKERCRSENVDHIHDSDVESDDEESEEQYHELDNERETLEEKKKKLEAGCNTLNTYIFKVISERNSNKNRFTKNDDENPFNVQLRNMNIVNELAMLNQYYARNNGTSSHDSGDLESNVSVDDSRTSENKLNDFVDYESSISVDGSRTEENTCDDFVEYDSNLDEEILSRVEGAEQHNAKMLSNGTNREIEGVTLIHERNSRSHMNEEIKLQKAWPENIESENEEEEEEEEEDEISSQIEELRCFGANLAQKKKSLHDHYVKLYDHILKAMETDEAEFLKTFMDYCITLLLKAPHEV